jgi:hypothetical protein
LLAVVSSSSRSSQTGSSSRPGNSARAPVLALQEQNRDRGSGDGKLGLNLGDVAHPALVFEQAEALLNRGVNRLAKAKAVGSVGCAQGVVKGKRVAEGRIGFVVAVAANVSARVLCPSPLASGNRDIAAVRTTALGSDTQAAVLANLENSFRLAIATRAAQLAVAVGFPVRIVRLARMREWSPLLVSFGGVFRFFFWSTRNSLVRGFVMLGTMRIACNCSRILPELKPPSAVHTLNV